MTKKIEIVRGTSQTIEIEVMDEEGNSYTLAEGERLLFGVKRDIKDANFVIFKQVARTENGVYTLDIEPADTLGLEIGRYVYDVGLEKGTKYFPVIKVSPFVIEPNVTKWGDTVD